MDIQQVLRSTVFGDPADTDADVARFFDPGYTQVTDGIESTYQQFVEHIRHVRSVVASGELTVHESAQEGNIIADRHTISINKTDGSTATLEVLVVGVLSQRDQLLRVVETTRQIAGDPQNANLGIAT